uniref:PDZ domain-containing protein n=1 Tax=Fagus sylvatica TaxID=28930 RepID=A0A2N9FQR1_FAGSY
MVKSDGPASYDAQWCIKIGVKFIEHWCHGVLFLILLLTDINSPYWLSVAASGTKGGSSGSPVIDWQGRAVALNAGSKSSSASAFFLPLERVVRALKFFQTGSDSYVNKWGPVSIPRGTLQVTFLHKGFDETRRLGLQSETEQIVRHASPQGETGMPVVDSVVPGGPAHKNLEPGDVLVRVNGEVITQFLKLETLLDDSVNQNIELQIERGGTPLTVNLVVRVAFAWASETRSRGVRVRDRDWETEKNKETRVRA